MEAAVCHSYGDPSAYGHVAPDPVTRSLSVKPAEDGSYAGRPVRNCHG